MHCVELPLVKEGTTDCNDRPDEFVSPAGLGGLAYPKAVDDDGGHLLRCKLLDRPRVAVELVRDFKL